MISKDLEKGYSKIKEVVGDEKYNIIRSYLYYRDGYIYIIVKHENPYQLYDLDAERVTDGMLSIVNKYIDALEKE